MAITHQLTALTRRVFSGAVRNLQTVDASAEGLALLFLDDAIRNSDRRLNRGGALGLGSEVIVRVQKNATQWYRGYSPVSIEQPETARSGRVPWYFGYVPLAVSHTDLRQNSGDSIFDLIGLDSLSELSDAEEEALFNLLNLVIMGAKEDTFEGWATSLRIGGQGSTPKSALEMDGLDVVSDRTASFADVAPSGFGQFEADDSWYKRIVDGDLGQTSLNLWEPREFDAAGATISFNLINDYLLRTFRWGGRRVCGLGLRLYATLENSIRSLHQLRPDGRAVTFSIPNFILHDCTFVPDIRAADTELTIYAQRHTFVKFGLPSSEANKEIPKAEGSLDFPCYFGIWQEGSGQIAATNGIYYDTQLYCDNRASITKVINLVP